MKTSQILFTLQWRHNGHDGVSNHRLLDCLLNRLFRRRRKKISKFCVTGLCEWKSPVTDGFPSQRVSNAENVSIWWRHHARPDYFDLNQSHDIRLFSKSSKIDSFTQIHFYPSALRAGGVLSSRFGRAGGRAGGCQTCGTYISVTAWRIFSIRSSMELSRPVVVHCPGNLPICPIWACPWAQNLSNLPQIGSRLCGMHISETAGWIYPI